MPRGGDDPRVEVGRLYDRHGASLYRYARMLLMDAAAAEDVVQQVFLALLDGAPVLDQEEHYLRRAVRNRCYSALRATTRRREDPPLLEAAGAQDVPEERLTLECAIGGLSPAQREVIHLHAFEGRTFQEVAEMTGESPNTIASRYRYALARLREALAP